ncbi:MAG: aminopeptidase [Candidatus Bathyarchaeia archaeon]|jgi:leucyl aminopeptidase (aminopeptidase T)
MFNYDALVRNVLNSTLSIQPGDDVIVESWDHGLPIADAFIYRLRELGAHPMLLFEHEETFWKSAESLPEEKLGKVGEHEWAAIEKAKGYVFITGPADFLRIWKNRTKFGAATAYNEEWYERAKRYRLKAARIALGYATQQRARAYNIPLAAWQRMLIAASTVDFTALKERVAKFGSLMRSGDVKLTASNGTNLNLRLSGRDPSRDDCTVDAEDLDRGKNVANIPSGDVLACPDETYAEGTGAFDRPAPFMGKWVGGVRLEFKNGLLSDYRGRLNAELLKASYDKATGERDRIAVIGVGVNPKAKTGFLQDSLAPGVVTVGIGGNDDIGGANKTDFYFAGVLTKATLTVDGKVIVENGKLIL